MAKKQKKSAKKATKAKSAAKPASKPAAKKSKAAPKGTRKVGTGGGASAGEVGRILVEMFNKGQIPEIEKKFWSPAIVSCEAGGMEWVGRKSVSAKNAEWHANNRIHGASAEGPYVGSTGFAVKFRIDVETLANGQRMTMEEVGVYTIRGGKIVREEFMYGG